MYQRLKRSGLSLFVTAALLLAPGQVLACSDHCCNTGQTQSGSPSPVGHSMELCGPHHSDCVMEAAGSLLAIPAPSSLSRFGEFSVASSHDFLGSSAIRLEIAPELGAGHGIAEAPPRFPGGHVLPAFAARPPPHVSQAHS